MITPVVVPVLAPLVFNKLNYNPLTDFTPVGHVCNFGFGLSVKADHPAKNIPELITWFKNNPQKASFGSPAAGSLPHFFGLLLGREAKVDMVHVPTTAAHRCKPPSLATKCLRASTWCWNGCKTTRPVRSG